MCFFGEFEKIVFFRSHKFFFQTQVNMTKISIPRHHDSVARGGPYAFFSNKSSQRFDFVMIFGHGGGVERYLNEKGATLANNCRKAKRVLVCYHEGSTRVALLLRKGVVWMVETLPALLPNGVTSPCFWLSAHQDHEFARGRRAIAKKVQLIDFTMNDEEDEEIAKEPSEPLAKSLEQTKLSDTTRMQE